MKTLILLFTLVFSLSLWSQDEEIRPEEQVMAGGQDEYDQGQLEQLMAENEVLLTEVEQLRDECRCVEQEQLAMEPTSPGPVVIINEIRPMEAESVIQEEQRPAVPEFNSGQYLNNYQYQGPSTFPPLDPGQKWPWK